jgi:3-hydroxyisobutyrate dehydrogenase-like beta-hydroxyacid dehydrogenase
VPPALGVIGLGAMGGAVAARLGRSGFPLMVFDIASAPLRYFVVKNQADIAFSPRMMAETCDVVVTLLPSAADLRETVLGAEGLSGGLRPGFTLVDMGLSGASEARNLAAVLAARGAAFVEAPACGTPVDARAGRLVIPVAGDAEAVERVMPMLRALGAVVVPAGAVGSATLAAALADYLRAAAALAAGEALLLAGRAGLEPAPLLDLCRALGALAPAVEEAFRPEAAHKSLAAGHTLGTVVGDLDATLDRARSAGLDLPFAAACRERWGAVLAALGPAEDHAALLRWLTAQPPARSPEAGTPAAESS